MAGLVLFCDIEQVGAWVILQVQPAADMAYLLRSGQMQQHAWWVLVPVVTAFSFIAFIFYRARRESIFREKETALQLNLSELELKVIRTQMNPHFIFNCLNSIHHFMHRNDVQAASDYLIKFSRLIRHVLETSNDRMIPLTEELQALESYLDLEKMRMNHLFSWRLTLSDHMKWNAVHVPPLLMQPLAENAIWHGMANRPQGLISIHLEITEDMLKCTIEDNGSVAGTKEPYDLSNFVKRRSHGLALVEDRLKILNSLYQTAGAVKTEVVMENNVCVGHRSILTMPYED